MRVFFLALKSHASKYKAIIQQFINVAALHFMRIHNKDLRQNVP